MTDPVQALLTYQTKSARDRGSSLFRASIADPDSTYWQQLLEVGFAKSIYGQPSLVREFADTLVYSATTPERAVAALRAYYEPLTAKQRQAFLNIKADGSRNSILLDWVDHAVANYSHSDNVRAMLQAAKELGAINFAATKRVQDKNVYGGFGGSTKTTPLATVIRQARNAQADWLLAFGAPLDEEAALGLLAKHTPLAWTVQFLERNKIDPHCLVGCFDHPDADPAHVGCLRSLLARDAAMLALTDATPSP